MTVCKHLTGFGLRLSIFSLFVVMTAITGASVKLLVVVVHFLLLLW